MTADDEPEHVDRLIGSSLDRHVQDRIRPLGTRLSFQVGEQVYRPAEPHPYLYLVDDGRFSFSRIGKSGRRGTFGIIGAGGSFGLFPLFLDIPAIYLCECTETAQVVRIGRESVNSLIDTDADVRWAVINSLAGRLKHLTAALHDERMLPLRHRLALRLPELASSNGQVPLNQTELADFLGVSRFALSKALRVFKESGLIRIGYGQIEIVDREGLIRYGAENSDLAEV